MREFDVIEKIGKKMPYKAPSEEFFTNFKMDMMDRVSQEQKPQRATTPAISLKLFVPLLAAVASLLIGLFIVDRVDYDINDGEIEYLISDNLDASMDSFFSNLSDEELAELLDNTYSQEDFYSTLPTND